MADDKVFDNSRDRLILPFLGPFYDRVAQPLGWVVLRVVTGGLLAFEGWPKITAPFAQVGFIENMLGIYPGWFWSPFLAILQFVGGIMIALGLFTRPIALASGIMLLMTYWFHLTHPYGDAFLTPAGIEALTTNSEYFVPETGRRLVDGGAGFLHQVQAKAELASIFWSGATLLFAAFGGGYLSLDRLLFRRQF